LKGSTTLNNGYIAHVRKADKKEQTLEEHLLGVSAISASFASKIGVADAGKLIGLMHDFGKYSQAFQSYISSATGKLNSDIDDDYVDAKSLKGKIDHSSAGAQWIWNELRKYGSQGQGELCGQILALCVASHHSGLIDCLKPEGKNGFTNRMNKADDKTNLTECIENANNDVLTKAKQLADKSLVVEMLDKIEMMLRDEQHGQQINFAIKEFYLGFFSRFLFSCLIDADRINSADFEVPQNAVHRSKNPPPWQVVVDRLETKLASFPIKNPIDFIRRNISDDCRDKALEKQGIYTLTVPTGGGKTYASLRYALHHAHTHKLDRIIYIIPYTSIIEQNAKAISEIIGDEGDEFPWVLEHHSNLEPEQQTWHSKLVSDNWDSPIVLTTMVQFLETLFGGGTRGVRRMHQLANSVLIFDEIQTLPISCTHIFCNALNFLVEYTKTTAVLCTATQPLLDNLRSPSKGQLFIPEDNELVKNVGQLFNDLKRVEIINQCKIGGWKIDEIATLAIGEFNVKGSCLIIVNTKAWAQNLYQFFQADISNDALFHLSTNQCPAHRKQILDKVRARLNTKQPVLCVSTQLMEAGVDVDFSCVVRFMAGLDSIAQAAGRCNRSGALKNESGDFIKGTVHVLNPDTETVDLLKDIKIGKDKALRVLGEQQEGDLLAPEKIQRYFQYYFFDRADEMVYPLTAKQAERNDSLLNLLCDNPLNPVVGSPPTKLPQLRQSFMAAGNAFKAIDAPTQSIIVQYGEGKEIVVELCAVAKEFNAKAYYDLLRRAQKFSVNVFPNVWKKLKDENAIYEIQGEGIYYLDERYYSEHFGLATEPVTHLSSNIC
jgi:CRISPR-associated endonuclease/helicase Cas3